MRLSTARHRLVHATPGEGEPQPSYSGMPDRHRPGAGSLAELLVQSAGTTKLMPAAYVLAGGTSPIDAELLRVRLEPGQHLAVTRDSGALDAVLTSFDGTCFELYDGIVLTGSEPGSQSWPKVTVVTVSFNQAKYLERCLSSVLSQKYPNLEYIVIDACSSDGSQDILRRYEPHLSRLVIERDEGQSDGLNKGFALATGDILTWINSDDALAPGALFRAVAAFQRFGVDMVSGGCERIDSEDGVHYRHFAALPFCRPVALGYAHQLVWESSWEKGDYFFQPEVLFTADIWRRSGGYLKKHLYWAMDWELWIRMAMAGASIVHIPAIIGRSREHPEQKTTGNKLYLHQLKSILLEHDDALRGLKSFATELPVGEPITAMPHRPASESIAADGSSWEMQGATDSADILLPGSPLPVQIAVQSRINRAKLKALAVRVLGRSRIERLRFRIERLKEATLARHYAFAGVRLVDAVSYARMKRAAEMLQSYEAETRARRYSASEERHRSELSRRERWTV
jgi:GT2 family glycosyltransferase